MKETKRNLNAGGLVTQDEKGCKEEPDVQKVVPHNQFTWSQIDTILMDNAKCGGTVVQNGEPSVPEREDSMLDEKDRVSTRSVSLDQSPNQECNANVFMEQERLILTCLRDCLGELITFGTIKGTILHLIILNYHSLTAY